MKLNAVLNQSIFRQFGGSTKSISSSVMICHPLSEGRYTGIVFQNNSRIGEFVIKCDDKEETPQADIDMSKFITQKSDSCGCEGNGKEYNIRNGGYAVFFSSFGEKGFHVELHDAEKQKDYKTYTTQKLEKGDLVVSMLLRPGSYEVAGSNKSKLDLIVDVPKDYKDYQEYLATPNMVTLSENGFSPASVKAMPGQGLVVKLDTDSNIDVKMLKAAVVKNQPTDIKSRRWVKPAPYVFKKKKKK